MKTSIIKIGNSKGIRIPKQLLEDAKLHDKAVIELRDGGLFIHAAEELALDEWAMLGNSAFAKEWDTPEEDAAWASLQ